MKSVISAATILIFIIILVVVSYSYTQTTVEQMLASIGENEKFVAKNDWSAAENEMSKLNQIWTKRRGFLTTITSHSVIEDIDKRLSKINFALKIRKNDEFFLELGAARLSIYTLLEQQKLSISNVF